MGREVDERVVQMKFENGQFEKGVSTSIRSIEQLKKGLNFDGVDKSFEKLDRSARAIDMSGLSRGIETVRIKFGLLQMTALDVMSRIERKVVDTGERMVKALTIEQVSAGWGKFAEKTTSVQTIMSATAKQFSDTGVQMEYVTKQLDQLNWFTDETSYNFTDMVNNIGKFTSNNIDLETAVTSMQGIANWAAVSGANVNEASRAMYNMSQAMSAGAMKLQDWISIENANMGTAAFKEMAIQEALVAGTLVKSGDQIVTANKKIEVSVESFRNTLSEGWLSKEVMTEVLNKYGAATNRLNQLYEELNANENVSVLTSDMVAGIDRYTEALQKAEAEAKKQGKTAEETAKQAKEAGQVVAKEVAEEWGITVEEATKILDEFQDETMQFGLNAFKAAQEAKTFSDAIDSVKDAVSTGWMKSYEYIFGNYLEAKEFWTDIANELYDLFAESGNARNEMLKDWKELGGRNYMVDAIHGIILSLTNLKQVFHLAFADAFGVLDGQALFDITKAIHGFILQIIPTGETLTKLGRILRGVFSIFDVLKTLLFGGVSKSFKLIGILTDGLNIDILEFLASIGDMVYGFRNWVHESTILNDVMDRFIDTIVACKNNFRLMIDEFNAIPVVQEIKRAFSDFGKTLVTDAGQAITELRTNFKRFLDYLKNTKIEFNLSGALTVWKKFVEIVIGDTTTLKKIGTDTSNFFKKVIEAFALNLGFLEKPIQALIDIAKHLMDELHNMLTGIKAVDIAIVAFAASIFIVVSKVAKTVGTVANFFSNFMDTIGGFSAAAKKWGTAKIIKGFGLALLALAVALRLIAEVPAEQIWTTVAVVGALGTMIIAFTASIMGLDAAFKKFKISRKTIAIVAAIGFSILALAYGLKEVAAAQAAAGGDLSKPIMALASVIVALSASLVIVSKLAPNITSAMAAIAGIGVAAAFLVHALSSLAKLDEPSILKGIIGIGGIMTALGISVGIMSLLSGKGKGIEKALTTMVGFGIAVKLIVSAVKSLSKINAEDAMTAIVNIGLLMIEMGVSIGLMNAIGGGAAKAGGTLLALGVALNLLVPAIKGLSSIDDNQLKRSKDVLVELGGVFVAAILATALGGKDAHKAGLMLIEMAAAITLLVVAVRAFGAMDDKILLKGVTAVSVLGLVFSTAIAASKNTEKAKASILLMTTALSVLMFSVYELSKIDTRTLIATAGSISAVLLAFGGSIHVMKKANIDAKTLVAISIMAAVADMFGYVFARMAQEISDPASAISSAAAISVFIIALSGAMRILSKSKDAFDDKIIGQLTVMAGIATAIGGVILVLTAIPGTDAQKALIVMAGIAALLPVMTSCFYLLTKIKMAPNKSTINKFVTFTEVIGALASVIFVLTAIPNTDARKAVTAMLGLNALIPVMTACFYGLSKIRQSPTRQSMFAFAGFSLIVGAIGTVIAAISTIDTINITNAIGVVSAIDLLIPVMTGCFAALSTIKGSNIGLTDLGMFAGFTVVAAALTGLISYLAGMMNLNFEASMQAIIMIDTLIPPLVACLAGIAAVGMIPVDPATLALTTLIMGLVGVLLEALVAVMGLIPTDLLQTAATNGKLIGDAIGGFIGGIYGGIVQGVIQGVADALPNLGTKLSEFMANAEGFFSGIEGLSDDTPKKAGLLAAAMVALTAADFLMAVETLAGGVINKISEAMGIDTDFAGKMTELGEAIAGFAGAMGDIDADQVKTAAEAALILSKVEQGIPPKGGALETFFGEQDIGEFGSRLKKFGEALAEFARATENVNPENVTAVANAGQMLTALEASVPRQDGYLQAFLGRKDLEEFGDRLVSFGEDLVDFIGTTEGIGEDSVKGAVSAGKMLVDLENNLPTTEGTFSKWFFGQQSLEDFGERLNVFGRALKRFVKNTKDIMPEDVQGAVTATKMLSDVESNLNVSGGLLEFYMGDNNFTQFGKNLKNLGEALVSFSTSLEGVNFEGINNAIGVLQQIVDIATIIEDTENIEEAIINYVQTAKDALLDEFDLSAKAIRDKAAEVVKWIKEGLVQGYRKYKSQILLYGSLIGNDIDRAIKKRLEIASPSAVMAENGKWIVEGLAEGITRDMSAEEAAEKKAANISEAFKKAFNNSDIFRQKLDLDFQLWEQTDGLGASEAQIQGKKYEKGVEELKLYAQDAAVYKAQLDTALKAFGAQSIEYIKAENTYKQALLTAYQKKNEVDQLVGTTSFDRKDQMKEYARIMAENAEAFKMLGKSEDELAAFAAEKSGLTTAHPTVQKYIEENRQAYEFLGMSYEQLEQDALAKSGLTSQKVGQQLIDTNAIIQQALGTNEVVIQESVAKSVSRSIGSGVSKGLVEADLGGQGKGQGKSLDDGLVTGIEKYIPNVKDCITKAGGGWLDTLSETFAINSPSHKTEDMGEGLDEGLILGINNMASQVHSAGVALGENTLSGMQMGLLNKEPTVMAEAQRIANQIANTISAALQINSPSKVMMKFGQYVSDGLANGMSNHAEHVSNEAEALATNTISAFDQTKSAINAILESDDDYQPVITPVLDLDDLQHQAPELRRALGKTGIPLDTSRARVSSILERKQPSQNGSNGQSSPQTNYNFVQNNYSPKALNRVEIYRQTRNQFSRLKEASQR